MTYWPGETFLIKGLQKPIHFLLNNKIYKKGKLLLYRKNHFFVQITILNEHNEKENFEIPFPLKTEVYDNEGLMYLDYRIAALNLSQPILTSKKISSSYFNKIMEVQIAS